MRFAAFCRLGFLFFVWNIYGGPQNNFTFDATTLLDSLRKNSFQEKKIKIVLQESALIIQNYSEQKTSDLDKNYLAFTKSWVAIGKPGGWTKKIVYTDSGWLDTLLQLGSKFGNTKNQPRIILSTQTEKENFLRFLIKAKTNHWGNAIICDAVKLDHFSFYPREYTVDFLKNKKAAETHDYIWAGNNSEQFLNDIFSLKKTKTIPSARSQNDIAVVVDDIKSKLKSIYTKYFGKKVFEGQSLFQITVLPSGIVQSWRVVGGNIKDSSLMNEIQTVCLGVKFIPINNTEIDTVNMPFTFIK